MKHSERNVSQWIGSPDDTTIDPAQDITVLNRDDLPLGLPRNILFGGIAATAGFMILFRSVWYLGLLFGFIYFTAAFGVHADDPKAADGWFRAMRRAFTWSGGRTKSRRIYFLSEGD